MKKTSGLVLMLLAAGISWGAEGRWSLARDKQSGKDIAVLQTDPKGTRTVLSLDPQRTYTPVSVDQLADPKKKAMAQRGGKFVRLVAKNSSATPIDGGRLLVFQEQTIVLPPQPEPEAAKKADPAGDDRQEPDDNAILVKLYDDSGKVLWSRKFGPLAGRLPVSRDVWAVPNAPELPFVSPDGK